MSKQTTTNETVTDNNVEKVKKAKGEGSNHQILVTQYNLDGTVCSKVPHRMFGENHVDAFNTLLEKYGTVYANTLVDLKADFSEATFTTKDGNKITLFDSFFSDGRRATSTNIDPRAALAAKLASLQRK